MGRILNSQLLILSLVLIFQAFSPSIYIGRDIYIIPDIILVYLAYLSFSIIHERFYLVIIGFLLGFSQDLISQVNLIGLFAFSKTIVAFLLGTISLYDKIWSKHIKILVIFLIFFVHSFLSYYMMYDRLLTPFGFIFKYSLIQSLLTIVLVYVVDKFILIDNEIVT